MKDKIYCFVKITSAKYRIDYIVTGRNIAYHGILFVLNETFYYYYFRLGRNVLFGPVNTFHSERQWIFGPGRNDFMRGNISSDYDIEYFVCVYCKNYESIYFVLHFIIMQHIKNHYVSLTLSLTLALNTISKP